MLQLTQTTPWLPGSHADDVTIDEDSDGENVSSDSDLSWNSMSPITSDDEYSDDTPEDDSAMNSQSSDDEQDQAISISNVPPNADTSTSTCTAMDVSNHNVQGTLHSV